MRGHEELHKGCIDHTRMAQKMHQICKLRKWDDIDATAMMGGKLWMTQDGRRSNNDPSNVVSGAKKHEAHPISHHN
jgi:hypothetical protein